MHVTSGTRACHNLVTSFPGRDERQPQPAAFDAAGVPAANHFLEDATLLPGGDTETEIGTSSGVGSVSGRGIRMGKAGGVGDSTGTWKAPLEMDTFANNRTPADRKV